MIMDTAVFIKGLIIGFSIAAPVGPIGLLCIQRTLTYGRLSGLLTGLGAATADGFYGAVAAFGLAAVSSFLIGQQFWLGLVGGLFLLYLGIKILRTPPATAAVTDKHKGLIYDYVSCFFLTLANPATILTFVAIFAGLGLGSHDIGTASALFMTVGVLAGSALWWLILSGGVSFVRHKVNEKLLKTINVVSGFILIGFSVYAFLISFGF